MADGLSFKSEITKGLFRENPVFAMLLGMCPVLGVTSTAINGIGMGVASSAVLLSSNVVVALIRDLIPEKVRIPAYIVVIASFVTVVDLTMAAYLPELHESLGLFIPLIVVNCLILGRAEAFASRNILASSVIDAVTMGVGFTVALAMLGAVREVLGSGSLFGLAFVHEDATTMLLFIMPPGAFIALGFLIAGVNTGVRKARAVAAAARARAVSAEPAAEGVR